MVEGAIKYPGQAEIVYKWRLPSAFDCRSSITMKQAVNANTVSGHSRRVGTLDPSAREPGLMLIFNGVVDWGWIGEGYCLFLNPDSLAALAT